MCHSLHHTYTRTLINTGACILMTFSYPYTEFKCNMYALPLTLPIAATPLLRPLLESPNGGRIRGS